MRRSEMTVNKFWPNGKNAAFTIRDDDISFFTQPWMLNTLYKEAWRLGFKISLGIIPLISANSRHFTNVISQKFPNISDRNFFSIADNKELVSYLMDKLADGSVDIIQHGFTHRDENGKAEFASKDFNIVNEKLRNGNDLIRKTFKRNIGVFVAPHEYISRATWKSLKFNNMHLCRKFTFLRLLAVSSPTFSNLCKLMKYTNNLNPFSLLSSSVIELDGILVIQWDSLFPSTEKGIDQLKEAKEKFNRRFSRREPYTLLQHYWEYFPSWQEKEINQNLLDKFNSFLKFIAENEAVWKTSLSDLCNWLCLKKDCSNSIYDVNNN